PLRSRRRLCRPTDAAYPLRVLRGPHALRGKALRGIRFNSRRALPPRAPPALCSFSLRACGRFHLRGGNEFRPVPLFWAEYCVSNPLPPPGGSGRNPLLPPLHPGPVGEAVQVVEEK